MQDFKGNWIIFTQTEPEPQEPSKPELERLYEMVDGFAEDMKAKLQEEFDEDYSG